MNDLRFPDSTICTKLSRLQIEQSDLAPLLQQLESMNLLCPTEASADYLRQRKARLGIFVGGYDDDSRELFEIPEVRTYFQALHAVWPYGLFFFARSPETLSLFVLCNVSARVVSEEKPGANRSVKVEKNSVLKFVSANMPALSTVTSRIGWPPQATRRFVREIAASFGVRSDPAIGEERQTTRQLHFDFLMAQYTVLAGLAWRGYSDKGRGVIVVPGPGQDNPSGCDVFFSSVDEMDGLECFESGGEPYRLVEIYDPEREIVVAIDDDDVTSTYRFTNHQILPPDAWDYLKNHALLQTQSDNTAHSNW